MIITWISWALFWYIRKIGNNLYKQGKIKLKIPNKSFSLDSNNWINYVFTITIIGALLYMFVFKYVTFSLKKITRFSKTEIYLLGSLVLLGGLVFLGKTPPHFNIKL